MLIPKTPTWASNYSNTFTYSPSPGVTSTYENRSEPSLEVQQNGILLANTITLMDINYQYNQINQNILFFKNVISGNTINLTASTRTISEDDLFRSLRVVNAGACTYTINTFGQLANLNGNDGLVVEVVQGGTGAITLSPGSNVSIETKTGFLPKTSGKGTRIFAKRYKIESGTEYWDVYGEVGT